MSKSILGVATAALLLPLAVNADDHIDDRMYLTPMVSYIMSDDKRGTDDNAGFAFGVGKQVSEHWNIEGTGHWHQVSTGAANRNLRSLSVSGLYFIDREGISPYAIIGLGSGGGDQSVFNGMSLEYGFGVMKDFSGIDLRAEMRFRSTNGARSASDAMFNLGANVPLGAAPRKVVDTGPTDSDGDGVFDRDDRCPDTEAGVAVNVFGCERDSDQDGVVDRADRCPGTLRGVRVDASGCATDRDQDGVLDADDRCPNTAAGARVDSGGCAIPAVIRLEGVNFSTDSSELDAQARATLDQAAQYLAQNRSISAEVAGHTDDLGDAGYNQQLSQRRAESVMAYLVSKGISADRLTAVGYGEAQPAASNDTESGRSMNRRVELRIL